MSDLATTAAPRGAFFLGTNFCGSTVFGKALGAHSAVTYLGEVDRLVQFGPSVSPGESEPPCHDCEIRRQPCPVWTSDRVTTARGVRHRALMPFFGDEFGDRVLVDGSKHPHWLRAVLADGGADPATTVAFVTARSPFAFCHSFRFRTGCQMWEAANVWRDVYYDALRLVVRAGLPLMVVRYEDFAMDPEAVLRPACTLLGIGYEDQMPHFQERPAHDIGGNYNVAVGPTDAAGAPTGAALPAVPEAWTANRDHGGEYWGKPFGGWVDDKWQKGLLEADVEQVLQAPGLGDVANLLGYELTREVAAWERRRTTLVEAGTPVG